jgi:O-methyltransferase
MLNRQRLENIGFCLDKIVAEDVAGDCMECGVWRGGAVIFMRGYLAAHQIHDRTVWVADSFEGIPAPSLQQDHGHDLSKSTHPMLAIDLETVQDLFARYGLLDDQVQFLKGWFKDTPLAKTVLRSCAYWKDLVRPEPGVRCPKRRCLSQTLIELKRSLRSGH